MSNLFPAPSSQPMKNNMPPRLTEKETIELFSTDVKEEFAIMRLEMLIYGIRDTLVEGSFKLPFISSFEFAFSALKSRTSLFYIAGLLQECWAIVSHGARFNTPVKDHLPDFLDKFLSKYSTTKEEQFEIKDLDRDLTFYWANQVKNHQGYDGKQVIVDGYKKYLMLVRNLLAQKFDNLALNLRDDFTVDCSISIPNISIGKVRSVADYLIKEGYIEDDSRLAFIGCFEVGITIPTTPIVWHDRNERNGTTSFASLYTVFNALGLPMTPENKQKICLFFVDGEGNAIDYTQLKERESAKLKKLETTIQNLV